MRFFLTTFFSWLLFSLICQGQGWSVEENLASKEEITRFVRMYWDDADSLDFEQAKDSLSKRPEGLIVDWNKGYGIYWVALTVQNPTSHAVSFYLNAPHSYYRKEYVLVNEEGREIPGAFPLPLVLLESHALRKVYPIHLNPGEQRTVFGRITDIGMLPDAFHVYALDKEEVEWLDRTTMILMAILLGALSTLILYTFSIYWYTDDISYGYYLMFTLSIVLYVVAMEDYFNRIFPEWPILDTITIMNNFSIAGIWYFGLKFAQSFNDSYRHLRSNTYFDAQIWPILILLLLGAHTHLAIHMGWSFRLPLGVINTLFNLYSLLHFFNMLWVGVAVYRVTKNVDSYRFLLIQGFLLLVVVLYILPTPFMGLFEGNFWTKTLNRVGIVLQMIFFAVALANRINRLKQEREMVLEENVKLVKEQNEKLEENIRLRTRRLQYQHDQLNQKNMELESALNRLEKTKNRFVQVEKMASLGVLTAGIGHEINNPLNFIEHGTNELKNKAKKSGIMAYQDMQPFFQIIQEGIHRVNNIVKSLSHFSRTKSAKEELFDVREVIDNCLTILHNRYKQKVDLIKDFDEVPLMVKGSEGRLHQAFLNILANAEQAIEARGEVKIRARRQDGLVEVAIQDSGMGIDAEHLSRIQDPFFTTKPPGVGTGLGLYITSSVIEEHNGQIEFNSQLGQGTTVIVTLPAQIMEGTPT